MVIIFIIVLNCKLYFFITIGAMKMGVKIQLYVYRLVNELGYILKHLLSSFKFLITERIMLNSFSGLDIFCIWKIKYYSLIDSLHQCIKQLKCLKMSNANYVTHSHTPKLDMLLHLQSLFLFSRFVKLYEIPAWGRRLFLSFYMVLEKLLCDGLSNYVYIISNKFDNFSRSEAEPKN